MRKKMEAKCFLPIASFNRPAGSPALPRPPPPQEGTPMNLQFT